MEKKLVLGILHRQGHRNFEEREEEDIENGASHSHLHNDAISESVISNVTLMRKGLVRSSHNQVRSSRRHNDVIGPL